MANTYNSPVSWWANHADEVGLGLGALLLLVAFGSLFGMAIPIATALLGAVTASGFVYLLATVTTVSSAAPPVTLMISIGVGLDYSLLIVTRYRQFIAEGHDGHDAAGLALASAGKAAMFAGLTVCIALLGLWLVPIPLVQTLGLAAAIGVAVMILAAMTLLPDPARVRRHQDRPLPPARQAPRRPGRPGHELLGPLRQHHGPPPVGRPHRRHGRAAGPGRAVPAHRLRHARRLVAPGEPVAARRPSSSCSRASAPA